MSFCAFSIPPNIRRWSHSWRLASLHFFSRTQHPPSRHGRVRAERRHSEGLSSRPWAGRRPRRRVVPSGRRDDRLAGGGVESSDPPPLLPSLRLDELLDELQVRLQAVLSTRDRVYSLLEAVVAVGSSLDLEVLLRSIVQTAVSLVDATYGAMGVIGDNDRLVEFIPVGLT